MGRKLEHSERWRHPKYNIGYVEKYGDVAYTRIAGQRRTLKMRFIEENRKQALAELERRIKDHLNGAPQPRYGRRYEPQKAITTLFGAMELYVDTVVNLKTKSSRDNTRRAFVHYFDKDAPLDETELYKLLARKYKDSGLARNSKQRYMAPIKQFFRWCVAEGLLKRNPAEWAAKEGFEYEAKEPLTPEQVELLRGAVSGGLRLAVDLMLATALRTTEAFSITWDNVTEEYIRVPASAAKGGRERYIVYAAKGKVLLPDVAAALDACMAARINERVLPVSSQGAAISALNRLMKKLGDAFPARTGFHALRRTAEDAWENKYGLSNEIICEMAGHAIAVREKHYRARRKGQRLVDAMEREMAG